MLRFIAPLVIFGLLVLVFIKGLDPERNLNELPSPFLGKEAPQFNLPRIKYPDERLSSDDYAGEMVLVNFWATWCAPCRQEHPFLLDIAESGIIPIYGIDWRDHREHAIEWLQVLGDPYIASGYDEDATTGIDWGVYAAPETFLISKEGVVLYKHLGALTPTVWQEDFLPLIEAEKVR